MWIFQSGSEMIVRELSLKGVYSNHIYRPLQRLELSELKVKDCFCWRNKTYERLSKGLSFSSGGWRTLDSSLIFLPLFLSSLLSRQQTSVRHCSRTIILLVQVVVLKIFKQFDKEEN